MRRVSDHPAACLRPLAPHGPFVALVCLAFAFGCGDDETRMSDGPGAAGQVGSAGSAGSAGGSTSGSGGSGGSAGAAGGSGGAAGSGGSSNQSSSCQAPSEAFDWPAPVSASVPADASWKADLALPNDDFFSLPEGDFLEEVRWTKFIVLASEPSKVYFQNATSDPFHYEFASQHIPAFQGMTRAEFDAVTLKNEGRQAVLGAVLVPGDSVSHPEYGVQLVSNEDLHPELVATILQSIEAHVSAPAGMSAYYFPSGVSAECIAGKAAALAARGVALGGVDRWLTGDACYAPGWSVGKLVSLATAEVDAAYLDGRLTPDDILVLTDTAPAELPFVAGILTLAPSTPNAHSAILARSYGVPFAYVRDTEALAALQTLGGKRVVLSTTAAAGRDPFDLYFGGCDLRFIDVDDLPDDRLAELRALAAPPAVSVTPKRASGALTLPADGLVPADIDRVGGKASNFGVLRAAAPERTPSPALALTFDLWDAFMDAPAPAPSGRSLRDEIGSRLAAQSLSDLRALDATLEGIRALIEDATFPAALGTSVLDALAGFDPQTRIRFRSSTNVEDSDTFTGAGLYDSATGCLADDLDADSLGPSRCNPEELNERGVLRAIQRVYSSFYFRNAYFERARRGVNEAEVGMGVLVHYSVPDPNELANGVATLSVDEFSRVAELVTQAGAVSVTNPDGTALPEQVRVDRYEGSEDYVSTQKTSSLLPLGAHVLSHEDDYRALMTLFNQVADEYAAVTSKLVPFSLDFEYKKVAPGELSLRQVRPLPVPDATRNVTPFFVGKPEKLCVYGSERADAFAAHRLKARIAISGANVWLTPAQLAERLYTSAHVDYVNGAAAATLEGDPAALPGASHGVEANGDESTLLDGWTAAGATWTLRTRLTTNAARGENPVRTPDDFFYDLTTRWATPVPFLDYPTDGSVGFIPGVRTDESVEFWGYCPEDITVSADLPHVQASFTGPNGLAIETSYWYPPPPRGATAGYTAPAIKWEKTTISGLTAAPIVLTGYFSQTYAPNHHNFGGQYIFDPRLEPGLTADARAELEAADVAYLVVIDHDGEQDELWALGVGGALRKL
jgi:Pyruvate phosphate dikinase, AMP/ATP-binding domain/PEP-utilising enzyme, mobile domain